MNKTAATNTDTVEVVSNLFCAGYTDDGADFIAESYAVSITDADGNRLTHRHRFPGVSVSFDEYGYKSFDDIRASALEQAERLVARVEVALARGHALNATLWEQDRPVYGSDAYVAYGQADDIAWEARCNEEEALGLR